MKRHLFYPFDFDARANTFIEIQPHWEENVRKLHEENQKNTIARLKFELGELDFEQKFKNFKDAGAVQPSIISYHNLFARQARYAFYYGLYYPSLLASCALGERILNHLIIDLRDQFKHSEHYKKVWNKSSVDDWSKAIGILEDWQVFLSAEVTENFRALATLRNRSVHFNPGMLDTLRETALQALHLIQDIISRQFGYGALPALTIPGTNGFFFLSSESLHRPFVKIFILTQCPQLGPYMAISFNTDAILFHDRLNYEGAEMTDEEFATAFNARTPTEVVSNAIPPPDPAAGPVFALFQGQLRPVRFNLELFDQQVAAIAATQRAAEGTGEPTEKAGETA